MSWEKETPEKREKRLRSLFTAPHNIYGYQLNVNNPVIKAFYEDWKRRDNIKGGPSDPQRFAFERVLWGRLRRWYHAYDKKAPMPPKLPEDKHISTELFGWRREGIEIFVNDVLDIDKALKLFKKTKIEVDNCDSN